MIWPAVTSLYAAIFGLLYLGLSLWVVAGRASFSVHHGDGGEDGLNRRIRAHGNFAEYVPVILLLAALIEAGGASSRTIHALLLPLLLARIVHPVGMIAPVASKQQIVFRGVPMLVTWLVLLAASVLLLMRAI